MQYLVMDNLSPEIALKKIKMRELEPELQEEIQNIAKTLNPEQAIKSTSSLHFLYELCQAEKEKHADSETLKKAEKLVYQLATLSHARIARHIQKKKKEKPKVSSEPQLMLVLSEKVVDAFLHLGIADEKFMREAVGLLGETEIIERSELVMASHLDEKTRKSLFGGNPRILLAASQALFITDIEIIEKKKDIFDTLISMQKLPEQADYRKDAGALLLSARGIMWLLELPPQPALPEQSPEEKAGSLPTMKRREFVKKMKRLGFEKEREVRHGAFYSNEATGKTIMIQNEHGKGDIETGIIREKLREAGVSVTEFKEA
jgi:predicted RNA binding protein YcfA (HicA-like mRNA interferase family)